MDKEVEKLKKKDIKSYIDFINETFDYKTNKELIEKLMKNDKILVVKDNDKVIASVIVEEKFEYIKNEKYYYLSYFGVLKSYRREGYASKLLNYVESMVKENKINYIEIMSGNQRLAAQDFYKNKNFKLKDTSVFVKVY